MRASKSVNIPTIQEHPDTVRRLTNIIKELTDLILMSKSDEQGHIRLEFSKLQIKKWPYPGMDDLLRNTILLTEKALERSVEIKPKGHSF